MRILNAYITRDYIIMFLTSLLVFLFVMAVGNIFRVIDLFARGVSGILILKVFFYGMPFSLIFAIPMSVLASSFLQFSRMSDDREITAMKASGVSVWQIVHSPAMVACVLCVLCVYINFSLAPASHYARRLVVGRLGIETPLTLLEAGRFVRDFPDVAVYVGGKYGNRLSDIIIHKFEKDRLKETIHAKTGVIKVDKNDSSKVEVLLYNVNVEQLDANYPDDLKRMRHISAEEYPLEFDMSSFSGRQIWKKRADLSMQEIVAGIRGEPLFICGDLMDVDGLVKRLCDANDRIGTHVKSLLSRYAVRLVDDYDESRAMQTKLDEVLMNEFNRLMRRPGLYDETAFARVRLGVRSKSMLNVPLHGVQLSQFNRFLLEDAFPREITASLLLSPGSRSAAVQRSALLVEANTRMALSFCCFAFALLGSSLGIKVHRKESSIGVALTLSMIFMFYFFIIIADALVGQPELQPHLIVWFPFLLSLGLASYLLRRAS